MNTVTISPLNNNISISGGASNGVISVSALASSATAITVTEGKQGIQGPSGVSVSVSNYGNNRLLVSDNTSSGVLGLSNIIANNSGIFISGSIVSLSGHQHLTTDISGVTASPTEINYLSGSIPGSGTSNNALVADLQGNIVITGHLGFNNGLLPYAYPRVYNNTEYLYIGNDIDTAVTINSYDGNATFAKNSFVINTSGGLICTSGNLNNSIASNSGLFKYLSVGNNSNLYIRESITTDLFLNTSSNFPPIGQLMLDTNLDRLIISNNKTTWTFRSSISAYNITDNSGSSWIIDGAIQRNSSGVVSLIGVPNSTGWYPIWGSSDSVFVSGNNTTKSLDFYVKGLFLKNIVWNATVNISSVASLT